VFFLQISHVFKSETGKTDRRTYGQRERERERDMVAGGPVIPTSLFVSSFGMMLLLFKAGRVCLFSLLLMEAAE